MKFCNVLGLDHVSATFTALLVPTTLLPVPPLTNHCDSTHRFLRLTKTLDVAFSTFRVYPTDFTVRRWKVYLYNN